MSEERRKEAREIDLNEKDSSPANYSDELFIFLNKKTRGFCNFFREREAEYGV